VDVLVGQVDAVINLAAITPEAAADLVPLVRPGGVIVSIATPVEPPAEALVTAIHFLARNDVTQLTEIVGLIDAGTLIVDVTESHPGCRTPPRSSTTRPRQARPTARSP
jgi:hypothetical protein